MSIRYAAVPFALILGSSAAHAMNLPVAALRAMAQAVERAQPRLVPEELGQYVDQDLFNRVDPAHQDMLLRIAQRGRLVGAPVAACFAEGTDSNVMSAFNRAIFGYQPRFQQGPRWDGTALNPNAGSQGDTKTLTYSFVPDGTPISAGVGEPAAPSDLFARMRVIYSTTNDAVWQAHYQAILDRWSALSGMTFIRENNDDGVEISSAPGVAGVRGDLRFGGHFIDGNSGILAYNYYPQSGDMVIDTGDNFFETLTSNSLRLRNVLAHEHGHGMGQAHVCPILNSKLMEPFVSTAYDGPQHDDVRHVQFLYGDHFEPNGTSILAANLGNLSTGSPISFGAPPAPAITSGSLLSVNSTSDLDYYKFTVTAAGFVTVVATPLGGVYDDSPQNCSGASASCCFNGFVNSLAGANLVVDVLGTDGSTVLRTSNSSAAGSVETALSVPLPAAGTYFIRVSAPTGSEFPQSYTLGASLAITNLAIDVLNPPTLITPGVITNINVNITGNIRTLTPGTARIFYRAGTSGAFSSANLVNIGAANAFRAPLPAQPCGQVIQYYISAQNSSGSTESNPSNAPTGVFSAIVGTTSAVVFTDDFEIDRGWTATASGGVTTGQWVRDDPNGTFAQPEDDHTSAGVNCYFTGQGTAGSTAVGEADLDGGSVFLVSPAFNLSATVDATIAYWRWYSNSGGGAPFSDTFVVEVSSNNGSSWTAVETVGPTGPEVSGGWNFHSLNLATFPAIARTSTMRLRFTAADLGTGSIIEAAVDDVTITKYTCSNLCVADMDDGSGTGVPDGGVGIEDLLYYLGQYDAGNVRADVDDGNGAGVPDGGVGIEDLLYYLARYDAGC